METAVDNCAIEKKRTVSFVFTGSVIMTEKYSVQSGPEVSVVMPAYNVEEYIESAVRSVMMQTVSDWELIIVDDMSQDSTCDIVEKLMQEDSRIHLYRNQQNLGAASTRNRGFDLCKGNYVALLDCDDIWYPDKLEKQLTLAKKETADIVYCSYAIIDESGKKKCNDFIVPERTNFAEFLARSVISCSTALLGKRVTENYRFPIGYYHEDLAMWLLLLGDGMKAVGVTEVLAEYRLRKNSRASNKLCVARKRWNIYRKYLGFSVGKSVIIFCKYAINGLRKYMNAV